jgi:hypothetical protein
MYSTPLSKLKEMFFELMEITLQRKETGVIQQKV